MSDSMKRYRAIKDALRTMMGNQVKGNVARHLETLTAMISGIVGSQSSCLPSIARKVPGPKPESLVKRFQRFLTNESIASETYFLPFAQVLLKALSHAPLILVIDGSVVARGCMTLMVAVVYKQRALPIAWIVAKRRKGHFPEAIHMELISKVEQILPENASVTLLGDGEFDGVNLQALVNQWKWKYVLRTSKTTLLTWEGEEFSFADVAEHVMPDEYFEVPNALFTHRKYGPILAITWWRKDCKEPIHLVTNLDCPDKACQLYTKRFKIETFFSDQKSRGFHLNKSRLSDPARISRLMMAACLSYFWIVYLGAYALANGWHKIIHRTNRCDLSLFSLGRALLDYLLTYEMHIPVSFQMPP